MSSAVGASGTQLCFAWDNLGRLHTTNSSGTVETYAYYPNGTRSQLLDSNAANNLRFVYNLAGQMLAEYTGSGSAWTWKGDVVYLG